MLTRSRISGNTVFTEISGPVAVIAMERSEIGGNLEFGMAAESHSRPEERFEIAASATRVRGALVVDPCVRGQITLNRASFGSLDWTARCWGKGFSHRTEHIALGMLSGTLEGRAEDGYSFLKANTAGQNAGGFAPQPWEECARVLRVVSPLVV